MRLALEFIALAAFAALGLCLGLAADLGTAQPAALVAGLFTLSALGLAVPAVFAEPRRR